LGAGGVKWLGWFLGGYFLKIVCSSMVDKVVVLGARGRWWFVVLGWSFWVVVCAVFCDLFVFLAFFPVWILGQLEARPTRGAFGSRVNKKKKIIGGRWHVAPTTTGGIGRVILC